jgi:hypothetical protein
VEEAANLKAKLLRKATCAATSARVRVPVLFPLACSQLFALPCFALPCLAFRFFLMLPARAVDLPLLQISERTRGRAVVCL